MDPLARVGRYLEWLVTHPAAELSRAQRFLRFAVNLTRHASHELRENDAGEMAAALTYRTLFGLVPLLMVSMLAFRLFGDMDAAFRQIQTAAYTFFNYKVDPGRPEALAFKEGLDERLLAIMSSVAGLRFETIGAVGALLLIWAALGLLVSLENSANRIYHAPRGRGALARIVIYWAVLTLGPLLLLTVLYAADFWLQWGRGLPAVGPLLGWLSRFGSLLASFLALLALYKLMPNTAVRWQPALAGALVAAVLWDVSKWGFGLYVSRALPYMRLYGAIGLVPLFLFWLYLNWLILLFGLQIAVTLQTLRGRRIDPRLGLPVPESSNPEWLLPIMATVARSFTEGRPIGRQELAEELQLRLETVAELVERLEEEGLVHQAPRRGSEDVSLALSRAPEQIPLKHLLDLTRRLTLGAGERPGPGWRFLGSLHDTLEEGIGTQTLADLLSEERR